MTAVVGKSSFEHKRSVAQTDFFCDNFYLLAFCIVENVRYKFTNRSDLYVNVEDEIFIIVCSRCR